MRILVTGSLGHIGSYLIKEIPKKIKCSIVMVDSLKTQRYCSLFNLPKKNNYTFIQSDVRDLNNFSKKIGKIDVVVHLAALTDATNSFENGKKFIKTNFSSTYQVLKFCKKKKSKLIYISSTSIYGSQDLIVDEDCDIKKLKPQSPYAISKLKEENLILKEARKFKLKCILLRFGTIYGISTGMRFHTAVNKFCFQAALNQPITVWKTAFNQVRPYLGVDDFNRSIIHILRNDLVSDNIFNIVSYNLSVRDIINKIKIYKKKLKISFVSHEIMNQLSYNVLNTKFKNTKFNFKSDLEKQIKNTIELFDNAKQ